MHVHLYRAAYIQTASTPWQFVRTVSPSAESVKFTGLYSPAFFSSAAISRPQKDRGDTHLGVDTTNELALARCEWTMFKDVAGCDSIRIRDWD
jgi:hypothetical protein